MQHPSLQQWVRASRKKLVDEKIIVPAELNRPIGKQGAHDAANYDWRYLCISAILP
jgi:hypothetical protein